MSEEKTNERTLGSTSCREYKNKSKNLATLLTEPLTSQITITLGLSTRVVFHLVWNKKPS